MWHEGRAVRGVVTELEGAGADGEKPIRRAKARGPPRRTRLPARRIADSLGDRDVQVAKTTPLAAPRLHEGLDCLITGAPTRGVSFARAGPSLWSRGRECPHPRRGATAARVGSTRHPRARRGWERRARRGRRRLRGCCASVPPPRPRFRRVGATCAREPKRVCEGPASLVERPGPARRATRPSAAQRTIRRPCCWRDRPPKPPKQWRAGDEREDDC